MSSFRSLAVLAAALPLTLVAARATAQAGSACDGRQDCAQVSSFVARVTDFRPSAQGRLRLIAVTVRFENRTDRVLRLGYVAGSGLVVDDQRNRYQVYPADAVRGIGMITNNTFDPKFELQPGEGADARFEFAWQHTNEVVGTRHDVELTVREIVPVGTSQLRLGREHALQFRGLGAPVVASASEEPAPAATPVSAPGGGQGAAAAIPAVTRAADACAGLTRCYDAGTFSAQVTSLTGSRVGNYKDHVLRVGMRIRNTSAQPIVLGYKAGSNGMVDEHGQPYAWGRPGTYDQSASGIGTVQGRRADPQFALRPGEARDVHFQVWRRPGNTAIGTTFSYDLVLVELEPLNGGAIRIGREYAVGFRDLREGAVAAPDPAAAGRRLLESLGRKIGGKP